MQHTRLIITLSALLLVTAIASISVGAADISLSALIQGLLGNGDEGVIAIARDIRLPRLLLGLIVGGTLGLAGAALQGLFRNPLAEPGIIGVSASASVGAVIALQLGLGAAWPFAVPLMAMGTSLIAIFVLLSVALRETSMVTLILLGVVINAFAGAITSLVLNLASDPFTLNNIILWLLGGLANRGFTDISLILPFVALGAVLMWLARAGLDALSLGEDVAHSLGIRLSRTRFQVVVGAALGVGAIVSVSGVIGFVGLVVPHMLRPYVDASPGRLLLPSAIGGAILVALADLVARLVPTGQELRLGVLTAIIGAPIFIHLLITTRRQFR